MFYIKNVEYDRTENLVKGGKMININEQAVEEQKKHSFTKLEFDFSTNRTIYTNEEPALVKSIHIDLATMVPQKDQEEPSPGVIRFVFSPETTDIARKRIRDDLIEKIPGRLGGIDSDSWFNLIPETGVVTQDVVQSVLSVLYENSAITMNDVTSASKAMGITPSANLRNVKNRSSLDGLHDITKPENDGEIARFVAGMHL